MIEKLCEGNKLILSPFINEKEEIYLASYDGSIYRYKDENLIPMFEVGGQPSGLFIHNSIAYVSDFAHQTILARSLMEKNATATQLVKEFEGEPLLGPNSLLLNKAGNLLYFTDSGPLGETSIENPKGSVFVLDLEDMLLRPLALNCMAHPSALAMNPEETVLYVCETLRNRVLKCYIGENGGNQITVFHQFSGKLGPTAIAVNKDGYIFVAKYEYIGKLSRSVQGRRDSRVQP